MTGQMTPTKARRLSKHSVNALWINKQAVNRHRFGQYFVNLFTSICSPFDAVLLRINCCRLEGYDSRAPDKLQMLVKTSMSCHYTRRRTSTSCLYMRRRIGGFNSLSIVRHVDAKLWRQTQRACTRGDEIFPTNYIRPLSVCALLTFQITLQGSTHNQNRPITDGWWLGDGLQWNICFASDSLACQMKRFQCGCKMYDATSCLLDIMWNRFL